ncbi:MAG: polymer-forming cytoskeletal protein [Bacteroidales bacterium]|nr:polymer-forming cytoskeletal protein [Bacteroidales bacterium]
MEPTNINQITQGTNIVGNIEATQGCRIDGIIKGDITCKAKVHIGPTGQVEGKIVCDSIEIEGRVKANITATDIISLKATAVLGGDIVSSKLSIEPGATFVGNCQIQNNRGGAAQPQPHPEIKK